MSLRELSPKNVFDAVKDGKAVLVDVREPREYAAERIHGACLYPLSTFDADYLNDDGSREIILHCGSGKRSLDALNRCVSAGKSVTAHLKGGLMAWKAAGYPIIAIDPATGQAIDPQS